MCHFGMWTVLAKRNPDSADSRKTFTSPLITINNLDMEPGPEREPSPEITFYVNDPSIWQNKQLIINICSSPASTVLLITLLPFEAPGPLPIP